MAELFKVNAPVRKPLFEGVQGENEARSIQFDIAPWVDELGDGAVTATAKRSQDSQPYPVTVTKDGNVVTWKPTSTDTAFAGVGSFQLEYTVDSVLAKTCIWSTMVAPSLDPAGDPPDPYDNWLADMREIAAEALQHAQDAADDAEEAEAWAVGQRGGVDVPSTDQTYHNNAKYWAEQSQANQYSAFITKSASGNIASFADGADDVPMKSLKVAIVPKQSGSGDPSPSNVRPISGTSTANVTVTGTNIWDEVWEVGGMNSQTGENTAETDRIRSKNYIPVRPSTSYRIRANQGGCAVIFFNTNKVRLDAIAIGMVGGTVFTTPSDCYFIRFNTYSNYGNTYNNDISINYPSTDTAYHAYNGHTTPVPLGHTVYGGEVNPISGELVIDRVLVDGGSYNWTYWTGNAYYVSVPNKTANATDDIQSDIYKSKTVFDASGENGIMCNTYTDSVKKIIYIVDGDVADAAALKTKLTGHQICYRINNPTTVQLTPAQVASLLGTNNVWSDAGSVEVEYRADPTLAYNEISPSLASVIAPVESTNTATRNYTTGSLLIMNNTLYKVTANIANGGAITPNTNVVATTLSEVISAL